MGTSVHYFTYLCLNDVIKTASTITLKPLVATLLLENKSVHTPICEKLCNWKIISVLRNLRQVFLTISR